MGVKKQESQSHFNVYETDFLSARTISQII